MKDFTCAGEDYRSAKRCRDGYNRVLVKPKGREGEVHESFIGVIS